MRVKAQQNRIIIALIVICFAIIGVVMLVLSRAATPNQSALVQDATASLSLTPNSGTFAPGSTISFDVKLNSSDAVASFQSDLTYDASRFTFVSLTATQDPFDVCVKSPASGAGKIYLACASSTGTKTGTFTVATIKLTVLPVTGSVSSTVSLADTSKVKRSDLSLAWSGPSTAATLTLGTSGGGGNGGGSGGGTGGSGGGTGGTGSSGGSSTSTGGTTGTSTSSGGSKPSGSSTSSGGGTQAVPSTVSVGEVSASSASVSLLITNSEGKPAAGVTVMLANKEAMSDANGIVTFTGVAPGKYKVTAKSGVLGASAVSEIVVADGATAKVQEFTVKLNKQFNFLPYVGIGAGAIVLIALLVAARRKLMEKKEHSRHFAGLDNKVYVGGQSDTAEIKDPANNLVASLVTPHDGESDKAEETEALQSLKSTPKVENSDTLEQIEKKVGANKVETVKAEEKTTKPADTANFTPNLILPKKPKPTNT